LEVSKEENQRVNLNQNQKIAKEEEVHLKVILENLQRNHHQKERKLALKKKRNQHQDQPQKERKLVENQQRNQSQDHPQKERKLLENQQRNQSQDQDHMERKEHMKKIVEEHHEKRSRSRS